MSTVVALGGNALMRPGERGTAAEQLANLRRAVSALQPVLDECGRAAIGQHIGEAGDAGQDMHRLDIEVRAFPAPRVDDFVHLVAHASIIGIILISRFSPRNAAPRKIGRAHV